MPDPPFGARLAILILLLGSVAGVEYLVRRERATRWREYLFLLACATAGGAFGAAFDQLSLAIAPEYFEIGKGIPRGDAFRLGVTMLGFRAGFLVGAVAAGVLMIAGRGLPLRVLARPVLWVPVVALLCAPLGLAMVGWLAPDAPVGMRRVAGLHAGLYGGAVLGTTIATARVRILHRFGIIGPVPRHAWRWR